MPNAVTTMNEGLQKVLSDLTQCMAAPDADMDFISKVQNVVVMRMKQGIGGTPNPGAQPSPGGSPGGPGGPGGPGAGGPPNAASGPPGGLPGAMGGPGGAIPGPGAASPPGVPGVRSMPQMPNPDEIRRLLQSRAGG